MLGIVATLGYYGLVQLGDGMIHAETLSVGAGVWLPNFVGGATALALIFRLTRQSGFGRHSDRRSSKEPKVVGADSGPVELRTKRWALQRYVASTTARELIVEQRIEMLRERRVAGGLARRCAGRSLADNQRRASPPATRCAHDTWHYGARRF